MVGVLLVSHGELCEQIMRCTAMIAGPAGQMRSVPLTPGESPESYAARVREALAELDTGDGVIALVDVLGGTPYHTVGSMARDGNLQIITGMNMPMLVYLTLEREADSDITALADAASKIAAEGIRVLRKKEGVR